MGWDYLLKKKIGIFEEVAYSYRLMQRLNQKVDSSFVVYSFSEKESMEDFLNENSLSVLLVGEDYYDGYLEDCDISNIIILSEDKEQIKDRPCIYKYQAAGSILKELKLKLNMTIGCGIDNESAVKIIGVYSPIGMCVKTGLAVNLSKKLGETNNVLYLNLSPFCGTELIEMLSGEKKSDEFAQKWSLSDVFYYAEQGVDYEEIFAKSIAECGGVKLFLPMEYPVDLQSVELEKWNDFFMSLNRGDIAQMIVVDFDETVSCYLQLFELCEKIYMPVAKHYYAEQKVKNFDAFIKRCMTGEVGKKIHRIFIGEDIPDDSSFENYIKSIVKGLINDG